MVSNFLKISELWTQSKFLNKGNWNRERGTGIKRERERKSEWERNVNISIIVAINPSQFY